MTSATTYKQAAIAMTPIRVIHTNVREFCYGCNRVVCVDVIVTPFLGTRSLTKCPECNSVIQYNGKRAGEGMKFISLFSGIGGFDLGFERAEMECAAQ